jgi:competence CoiA-like predicted nuclease
MQFIRPKRIPEANIQAELYKRLKDLNIESMLEYRFKDFHLRADLVVIKNNEIICACEVKSRITQRPIHLGKQFQKYLKIGVPIFYCLNQQDVDKTIERISVLYNKID